MNGKEVDFISNQINTISSSLATPQFTCNGYYDKDNQRLFHIIDNNLWWGSGTLEGNLFVDSDPTVADKMFSEMLIAPNDTMYCSTGEYRVFYLCKKLTDAGSKWNYDSVKYTLSYNTVVPGNSYLSSETELLTLEYGINNGRNVVAAASLSGFIPGTQTRRLYLVYYREINATSYIKFFNINYSDANGATIDGPYNVATTTSRTYEPCEVEVSSDFSKIAFTRPKYQWDAGGNNTNDLTIVHLNPSTGYLNTSLGTNGYTYVDLGPANSLNDHYIGLEFSPDNNIIYVTCQGTGLYQYNIGSNTSFYINGTGIIGSSQLEYARDGFIYGVASNGQMYTIEPEYGTFATSSLNITSSGVINNAIFNNASIPVYTLPRQIDGFEYGELFGDETECCVYNHESVIVNPISGVSEDGDNIVITGSNVIWNTSSNPFNQTTDIYMKGNLIIQPNAKLTITDLTLHFKENQKVQLNQNAAGGFKGAYLYLNNSKLTAFEVCDETTIWLGVEANGAGSSYVQIPFSNTKQPQVEMRNGSVIEYAEAGINAQNGSFVRSYSGCSFKDNIVDVHINNFSPQNYSQFYETAFYTTQVLYDQKNVAPTIHAHIWTAPGVQFKGCSFRNDATSIPSLSARGSGILSDYSQISVQNNNSVRGEFENLWYGIKANGGAAAILTECDFSENLGGAWFVNNNSLSVTKCDFNVGNTSYYSSTYFETYGLYLESCTGYQIEENVFHDGLLGMVVFNSGYANNRIYKNDFYNINLDTYSSAVVAIGYNAVNRDIINGLQFICNDFNFTIYAIAILGGEINTINGSVNIPISNICKYQGYDVTNLLHVSSDNTFWLHGLSGEHDFSLNTTTQMGCYRYNGAYDNLLDRDANINSFNGTEVSRHYYGTFTTREQECPSNLNSGLLLLSGFSGIGELNDEEVIINSEIEELTENINETALLIAAQTATQNNVSSVHSMLMSASPYLSDTVLSVYLNNANVSEYSRAAVMVANSPLPASVKSEIDDSELSDELKEYINQFQDGVNLLEQKYLRLESIQGAKQQLYDNLSLAAIRLDTTEYFNQVIELLELSNDTHAKECLANIYVYKNEYDRALVIYESLMQIAETKNNTVLFNSSKIQKISTEILMNPENFERIITDNSDYLEDLASDYETKEGGAARAILASAGLMEISPITILPSEISNKSMQIVQPQKTQAPSSTSLKSLFRIYPNPANDQLAIEFVNPQEGNCTFNVYSLKGELLQTVNSSQQLGFITIPVSQLAPGTYIIECPQLKSKTSFVISR